MFEDKILVCKDCGNEFVFTAGEQQFYEEHEFRFEPLRCKDCRVARKQNRRKENRVYYTTVCSACGGEARIPFAPIEGRPAYCSNCYEKIKLGEIKPEEEE